jgi:membrane protease YdiL (CAAX protease family)
MLTLVFFSFLLFTIAILSLWIWRDTRVWGSLLALCLLLGWAGGILKWEGLLIAFALAFLWAVYVKQKSPSIQTALFILLIILSFGFKWHLFPGYPPFAVSSKLLLGFSAPLIGFFPLALIVPLAKRTKDWTIAFKGFLWGCLGIFILAILGISFGVAHLQFSLPSFALTRFWANLILTILPEEGFYRGFIQKKLCAYFQNIRFGKGIALFLTSIIFTLAHLYWAPSIGILVFVFLASLLYGGTYLVSERIESPILCHFLLNFIHMTFFSYHRL